MSYQSALSVVAIATLMSFDFLLDTVQVNMLVSAISKGLVRKNKNTTDSSVCTSAYVPTPKQTIFKGLVGPSQV